MLGLGLNITKNRVKGGGAVDNRLIFSVKTDNAGTSASNQFTIPTIGTGYLYDIETSDGQSITGLTSGTTITFPSAGTYDVFISGSFPQFYFNNTGDRLKLLNLKNFGIYGTGSTSQLRAFWGCSNMNISATDIGHFENVTDFSQTWDFCPSMTSFPLIDTSSGTNFSLTWRTCGFTTFPLIDMSNAIIISNAWRGCNSLTSFPLLDFSNVTTFSRTWSLCSLLENFPSNSFDTSISTVYSESFISTNLTTESIDNILISLDTNGVLNGTFAQSGGSNTPSATGLTAKANLISKGWTVTTN